MHPNFYHWHERADPKPDTTVLNPRWDAAAEFAKNPNKKDVVSLLLLGLFPPIDEKFAGRFTEAIVKGEPTFPIRNNGELLRVMAAVAIYSCLERPTTAADALSL